MHYSPSLLPRARVRALRYNRPQVIHRLWMASGLGLESRRRATRLRARALARSRLGSGRNLRRLCRAGLGLRLIPRPAPARIARTLSRG